MKGYLGIGIEGPSKSMNVGTLFRTAHAFGAAFVFTLRAQYDARAGALADTSDTPLSVPTYRFADLESFRHPRQCAYILGSEREGLSPGVQAVCDYVVKIPTRFSVNLGTAGALVMYDRLISLGRHAPRPVGEGAPTEALELPVFGEPLYKRKERLRQRKKEQAKQ